MAKGERPEWLGLVRVGGYRAWSRGAAPKSLRRCEVSQDVVNRRRKGEWEGEGGGEGEGEGAGEGGEGGGAGEGAGEGGDREEKEREQAEKKKELKEVEGGRRRGRR